MNVEPHKTTAKMGTAELTIVCRPADTDRVPRPRVLFVDDNITHLDLYTIVLQRDLDVLTATRGETGYALACTEHPDAIVIDCIMPDSDGLAICERLLANPDTGSIPLVVLTGDDGAFVRAMAMRSLSAVLMKPCPAATLLHTIHQALSIRTTR